MNGIYKKISSIAPDMYNNRDPVSMCLVDDINKSFYIGDQAANFKTSSRQCQALMSDVCSVNWDDRCEFLSNNTSMSYPNTVSVFSSKPYNEQMMVGDILVRNTAIKKYCKFKDSDISSYYFDPTNPDSPLVQEVNCSASIPQCTVDPKSIDSDVVMNKILANPVQNFDLLQNIYYTCRRGNISLEGTKIGKFLETCKQNGLLN